MEAISDKSEKNPFEEFSGVRIHGYTDGVIKDIWEKTLGGYEESKYPEDGYWKILLDSWSGKEWLLFAKARLFQTFGYNDNAIEDYKMALSVALKNLGYDHTSTAAIYNNLGKIYTAKANYDEAIAHYEKVLEIRLKVLGNKHPHIATSYNNLGLVHRDKGEYDKAIDYYDKALQIKSIASKFGWTHNRI